MDSVELEHLVEENARLREEVRRLRDEANRGPASALSSEQVYRSIFRLSPSVITVTRFEDGTYYDVNDTFCRLVGVTREHALAGSSLSLGLWVDPADRERIKEMLLRDGAYANAELDYRVAVGIMHCLQSAELVTIGQERFIIAVSTDITQRKRAEAMMARERERLAVTLQSLSDGVLAIDEDGRVELMNRVAADLLEVDPDGAIGASADDVLAALSGREPAHAATPASCALLRKDGSMRRVVVYEAPIVMPDGACGGRVVMLRDLTVQLQMEEHLRKASRLEALGILAGGIAHDFNNILMSIQTNAEFARGGAPEKDRLEALDDVQQAVRHARDLTQQLLTFSRGGAPIKQTASIGQLLQDVTSFALRGSALRAELDIAPDVRAVEIDRSQVSQVVENLVVNAVQAMPDGGSLRVSADNTRLAQDNALSLPPGVYVRIRFTDDGPGIAAEDLPRIFDPFFSRREGGTGLGLSIVHSVVTRHGGRVQVESEVGKGARFDVYLPASEKRVQDAPVEAAAPRRGRERILVMDDDAMVRRSLQRLLTQLGYRVDAVADGVEAMRAFELARTQGSRFALALLDLTVPGGMGGLEAARTIRGLDPQVRIVVSSGYSEDAVMSNPAAHGFDACIAKPHDAEELCRVLLACLGTTVPQ